MAGQRAAPAVGVLALQGDVPLHFQVLESLGAEPRKVRLPGDLQGIAGLVLPGGESTSMVRLAKDYGLFEPLRQAGNRGMPMLGTCAGAILLGRGEPYPERLGLVPVTLQRNAYGRQRESFEKRLRLELDGKEHRCIFIRAPRVLPPLDPEVEVLGRDGEDPVLLRYRHFLLSMFHPELAGDPAVHRLFLSLCGERAGAMPAQG